MTEISVPIGTQFESREEVSRAGLHIPHMAGIHPQHFGARAESIVISGGYKDDEDYGDSIIYTGHGGQKDGVQVKDQVIEKWNRALVRAEHDGTPVRVIRGHKGDPKFSPISGYRYDGLYRVQSHWFKRSIDGPLIVQFALIAIDYGIPLGAPLSPEVAVPPSGNLNPERRPRISSAIVRDQRNIDWIKDHYDNTCQVCRVKLMTDAGPISVGAHIQGLGKPFSGPDVVENMLCLCHNCHAIFDCGAFFIEDDCATIKWLYSPMSRSREDEFPALLRKAGHEIGLQYVRHHRQFTAGISE
jgi:putative restriction endonuclease